MRSSSVDGGRCLFMSVDELLPSVSRLRCHTSLLGRNLRRKRYSALADEEGPDATLAIPKQILRFLELLLLFKAIVWPSYTVAYR